MREVIQLWVCLKLIIQQFSYHFTFCKYLIVLISFQLILCSKGPELTFSSGKVKFNPNSGKLINKLTNEPIVLETCGLTKVREEAVDDKIIGGYEALNGQFPYQVLLRLRRKDKRVMICGGYEMQVYFLTRVSLYISSFDSFLNKLTLLQKNKILIVLTQ